MNDLYLICGGISLAMLCFHLGKLNKEVSVLRELSQVSFFASFWACIEANGLKNATVIRSIIEKYNPAPMKQGKSDLAQKMMDELTKASLDPFPDLDDKGKIRGDKIEDPRFQDDLMNPNDLV